MQLKSIAPRGGILQYFRPSFKLPFVIKIFVFIFLSGRFTQVLLYNINVHVDNFKLRLSIKSGILCTIYATNWTYHGERDKTNVRPFAENKESHLPALKSICMY